MKLPGLGPGSTAKEDDPMREPVRSSVRPVRAASTLAALALVVGLGACDDDGRFDQDRYQEQDQGATGASDATSDPADDEVDPEEAPADTDGTRNDSEPADDRTSPASEALDEDEVAGLLWMREEEQLAHDVYVALGERWGLRVFENIAASEQTHIAATIDLLDRYEIPDPAADNEPGTFTDPAIQELYDDFVARGLESRVEALTVGATIEELDIADLRARADATDEATIDDVYARLERASRNHLRAFVGQLELLGVEYEPTVLDDFEEIVAAPMERGRDEH